MLRRRLKITSHRAIRYVHRARTASFRADVASFHKIREMLRSDPTFRAFHDGTGGPLPDYYQHLGDRMLGRYAELLSRQDRKPDLSQPRPTPDRGAMPAGIATAGYTAEERAEEVLGSRRVGIVATARVSWRSTMIIAVLSHEITTQATGRRGRCPLGAALAAFIVSAGLKHAREPVCTRISGAGQWF